MPTAPNPDDFKVKFQLEAGLDYVWVEASMIRTFQDLGFVFRNRFTDSNGARYNLMSKGKPQRSLSADNMTPTVAIHYPDAWEGTSEPKSDDSVFEDAQIEDPDTLKPTEEFSLDG